MAVVDAHIAIYNVSTINVPEKLQSILIRTVGIPDKLKYYPALKLIVFTITNEIKLIKDKFILLNNNVDKISEICGSDVNIINCVSETSPSETIKIIYLRLKDTEFDSKYSEIMLIKQNSTIKDINRKCAEYSQYPPDIMQRCATIKYILHGNGVQFDEANSLIITNSNIEIITKYGLEIDSLNILIEIDHIRARNMISKATIEAAKSYARLSGSIIIQCVGDGNCFNRVVSYHLTRTESNHELIRNDIVNIYLNDYEFLIKFETEENIRKLIPISFINSNLSTKDILYNYGNHIKESNVWMGSDIDVFTASHLYSTNFNQLQYYAFAKTINCSPNKLSNTYHDVSLLVTVCSQYYKFEDTKTSIHYDVYDEGDIKWEPPKDISSTLKDLYSINNQTNIFDSLFINTPIKKRIRKHKRPILDGDDTHISHINKNKKKRKVLSKNGQINAVSAWKDVFNPNKNLLKKNAKKVNKKKATVCNKRAEKRAPRDPKTIKNASKEPKISQVRKTLAHTRVKENPDHHLTVINDIQLYCQPCDTSLSNHKSNVDQHIATKKHKLQLDIYLDNDNKKQIGIIDCKNKSSLNRDIKNSSILAACMAGIPASQICLYNKLMANKTKKIWKCASHLIQSHSSFSESLSGIKTNIQNDLRSCIDLNESYVLIFDEMCDRNCNGGLLNVLYNADCNVKSIMIQCIYIVSSPDGNLIVRVTVKCGQIYQLNFELCTGLYGDSTAYMIDGMGQCQTVCKFATIFPDGSHLLADPMKLTFAAKSKKKKNELGDLHSFFADVIKMMKAAHNYFKNSKERRNDYKAKIRTDENKMTKAKIEAILDEVYEFDIDLNEQYDNDEDIRELKHIKPSLHNFSIYIFNQVPPRILEERWVWIAMVIQYFIVRFDFMVEYFKQDKSLKQDNILIQMGMNRDGIFAKLSFLDFAFNPTVRTLLWMEGYGEGADYYYNYIAELIDNYNVKIIIPRLPSIVNDSIPTACVSQYLNVFQKVFNLFKKQHSEHFSDSKAFMKYYENARNFNPAFTDIPSNILIAQQHIPFGYTSFKKDKLVQASMVKEWKKYLLRAATITKRPTSLYLWWKEEASSFPLNAPIAMRIFKSPRGATDVERSMNHLTDLMQQKKTGAMGPVNKEVRAMENWNSHVLAPHQFGVNLNKKKIENEES